MVYNVILQGWKRYRLTKFGADFGRGQLSALSHVLASNPSTSICRNTYRIVGNGGIATPKYARDAGMGRRSLASPAGAAIYVSIDDTVPR